MYPIEQRWFFRLESRSDGRNAFSITLDHEYKQGPSGPLPNATQTAFNHPLPPSTTLDVECDTFSSFLNSIWIFFLLIWFRFSSLQVLIGPDLKNIP